MSLSTPKKLTLDYAAAADAAVLDNLSGIAAVADVAWTVADEGRTLECLRRDTDGYVLSRQVVVDDVISGIPGRDKQTELDLESIDIADGVLWLCASHCRTRRKNGEVRERPSRHLLAALQLSPDGGGIVAARALPFQGDGSLRERLGAEVALRPYLDLPTKENGLDIEGLAVFEDGLLLGLRGPVIDGLAAVVQLQVSTGSGSGALEILSCLSLDLGGLAIRELAHAVDQLVVLAGPVGEEPGPFRMYAWRPDPTASVQRPVLLHTWPSSTEKPEALCALKLGDRDGLATLYDSPDAAVRRQGTRYIADWFEMPPPV